MAVTPFRQRQQHHAEIAAARREVVFVARRGAAVAHLLQQSVIDQFLQAARQNIGRDVAAFLKLVKAGKAREGIAQDHDAPAVADAARAAGDGAGAWQSGSFFHGLSSNGGFCQQIDIVTIKMQVTLHGTQRRSCCRFATPFHL